MQNDEKNAGEQAAELELELETTTGEDPLDSLGEEELRAEAKKLRAIANRKKENHVAVKKEEPAKTVIPPTDDFIKKSDVAKFAARDAKELVSDEVKEHWDDLIGIPLGDYDNLDAKSIAKNMTERLVIYKARNPQGEKKEDVSDLTTTKANGTGSGPTAKTEVKNPPNFNLPKQPKDWYQSPEKK